MGRTSEDEVSVENVLLRLTDDFQQYPNVKPFTEYGRNWVNRTNASFTSTLRRVIDSWICSGHCGTDPTPSDCPIERNLDGVPQGESESLQRILGKWRRRNQPYVGIERTGKVRIFDNPPRVSQTDPEMSGRNTAFWFFLKFLNSHNPHGLARCANCSRYFSYMRVPRRILKRGTFCPSCKDKSSVLRTKAARIRRQNRRIALAADVFPRWKPRYGKRSVWVATRMNRQHEQIGQNGKWVTQNEGEILAELKRRKACG
jgi:hypothetical protein